jgi:TRAP-type C4-dicarboxylate transport system permease large subunit
MPEWTEVLLFGMFLMMFLSAVGLPIAFSLAFSAFVSLVIFRGWTIAFAGIKTVVFGTPNEIALLPIPLFVLMASLLIGSGLSGRGYDAVTRIFAGFKFGLPVATNAMLAFFGALMGSSAAAIGMATQMGAPELKARGYSNVIIAGVIAGGSGLAVIIPPSILMILYCFVMQQGVIPLFAAGSIPGILIAVGYTAWIMIYIWRNPPSQRPAAASTVAATPSSAAAMAAASGRVEQTPGTAVAPEPPPWVEAPPMQTSFSAETHNALEGSISWRGRWQAALELTPLTLVAIGTLGSMFLGFASITEAAALGVLGVLIVAALYRSLTWRGILWALWNAIRVSGFIMLLIVGGRYFGQMFSLTGVTREFSAWIADLPLEGLPLLFAVMGVFLLLGCIMETISIMLVLVPIAATALVNVGFDPILVGILFVINLEMALTTPPIGINLFVVAGMARPYGITFGQIVWGAVPFLVVDAIAIVILVLNPWMATWLAGQVS